MVERILHCWEDGPRTEDDRDQTCMLLANHAGPHEWIRDDAIFLGFAPGFDADEIEGEPWDEDGEAGDG